MDYNKPFKKMTVKELQKVIREQTAQANKAIVSYNNADMNIAQVNVEIAKLQEFGAKGKKGGIGLDFRGKKKMDLVRQARELKYFNEWDIQTPEGQRARSDAEKKAYKKFRNRPEFKGIEYEEWRSMVEAFGAVGDKLNSYGYEGGQLVQAYKEVPQNERKVDIYTAMTRSMEENKSLSVTERMLDIIRIVKGQ